MPVGQPVGGGGRGVGWISVVKKESDIINFAGFCEEN